MRSHRAKFRATRALLLGGCFLLPPLAAARQFSVVVDDLKPGDRKIIAVLERDLGPGDRIRVHDIRSVDFANPVAKGRFLSQIAAADLVIPIGDSASRLVSEELDDLRTFFIAAGGLGGAYLRQRHVAGILSYSPEETVRVAKALLPELKTVGVLYTPGYESVAARMESAAQGAGVALAAHRVASRPEIGAVARDMAARSDLLWIVGDPLFTQDVIFAYLLQETLRLKKPLAVPLPGLVAKGSLFCTVPDDDKLAGLVAGALERLLAAEGPPADRLRPAPPDGFVLVNQSLMEKWSIRVPPSLRLWQGREP